MSIHEGILSVKELNVVNGCQSLSTIFSYSELAKKADNAYIMFRFYEIQQRRKELTTLVPQRIVKVQLRLVICGAMIKQFWQ